MAVSNYNVLQAIPAGEDLSKAHGVFVKVNDKGKLVRCAAATDPVVGVVIIPIPYDENDDRNCPGVCTERGVKVPAVASGAITIGSPVALAADGKIAAATSGTVIGVALEAATAADDVITIMFTGPMSAGSASAGG